MCWMKKLCFLIAINIFVNIIIYYWASNRNENLQLVKTNVVFQTYLLFNSKCKVPDYEAYNGNTHYFAQPENITCTTGEPLTQIMYQGYKPYLVVMPGILDGNTECCYCNVTSKKNNSQDLEIEVSACEYFMYEVEIANDVIFVKCYVGKKLFYSNVHAVIFPKLLNGDFSALKETRKPSVLILGISSVSRLDFRKLFPETYYYLQYENWIDYKIFNRVSSHPNHNLITILTGKIYRNLYETEYINNSEFTWSDFQRMGYITAYAKDSIDNGVCNVSSHVFREPPTDYYFRRYLIASHMLPKKQIDGNIYCTGPHSTFERILSLAKDFLTFSINRPSFSIFWMDSFSQGNPLPLFGLDANLKNFFRYLRKNEILQNTIVIFLSDQGPRHGKDTIREWFAEQLPFLFVWLPPALRRRHIERFHHISENSDTLVTPIDLFLTTQEILAMYNREYKSRQSEICPRCKSLFKHLPKRSCREAQIDNELCSCLGYQALTSDDDLVRDAQKFIYNEVNITDRQQQMNGTKTLIYAWVSQNRSDRYEANDNFLRIKIETVSSNILEAILGINYFNGDRTFTLVMSNYNGCVN